MENLIIKQSIGQSEPRQASGRSGSDVDGRSFNDHLDDASKDLNSGGDSGLESGPDSASVPEDGNKDYPKKESISSKEDGVYSDEGANNEIPNHNSGIAIMATVSREDSSFVSASNLNMDEVASGALTKVQVLNGVAKNNKGANTGSDILNVNISDDEKQSVVGDTRILFDGNKKIPQSPISSDPTNRLKKEVAGPQKVVDIVEIDIDSQLDNELDLVKSQRVLASNAINKVNDDSKIRVQSSPVIATDKLVTSSADSSVVDMPSSLTTEAENTKAIMTERTHILNKNWGSNMSNKINNLISKGADNIVAKINPSSMGPIEIQIKKMEDGMNISIFVNSLSTKEVLDMHSEKMQKSFADGDMNLMNFDINHRERENSGGDFEDSKSESLYSDESSDAGDVGETIVAGVGLIDSYA